MKILVAVLASENGHYPCLIENGIRKTWGTKVDEDFEIVYYYGKNNINTPKSDEIYIDIEDNFSTIGTRTVLFFEQILKTKSFDYLLRVSPSSLFNIEKYKQFLADKPTSNLFCALVGYVDNNRRFGSGAGYTLSRDVVELIVKNKHLLDHTLIDDLGVSFLLLEKLGIPLIPAPRQDFYTIESVPSSLDKNTNHFHYRCKSASDNPTETAAIMQKLYSFFKN